MTMMRKFLVTVLCLACLVGSADAQYIISMKHLNRVKENINMPVYASEYKQLIKQADKMMRAEPVTVMSKEMTPASGTKHDYMSLGCYYWPDTTKADGLPWIQRDGQPNPKLKYYDREKLTQLGRTVRNLSLACYLSGNAEYGKRAAEWLKTFFLNEDTKMNPNLNYSQVVPGRNGGKGRSQGVIDTYSFIGLIDGIKILEHSGSLKAADAKALKAWFSEYLQWMLTSGQPLDEAKRNNNHGTARDIQVAAFANYVGNSDVFNEYVGKFAETRMFTQIEPDGRQPMELKRTLAFHYSIFNLEHMMDLFFIARSAGRSIENEASADGRSFWKALDYIAPYMGKNVEDWPYKQIHEWDKKQQELCNNLYRAYLLNGKRTDYRELFVKYRKEDGKNFFTLFYVEPEDAALLH